MKPLWFFIIPLLFFSIMLTGGIGISPVFQKPSASAPRVNLKDTGAFSRDSTLQLRSLDVPVCQQGGNIAVELVIDTSGSMAERNGNKIAKLKDATNYFFGLLNPEDVIGVYEFGTNNRQLIPINTKSANLGIFENSMKKIEVYPKAGTPTSKGLAGAKEQTFLAFPKYPNHQKIVMLVTDGCPNPAELKTVFDSATAIKNNGIRIVTVGIELGSAQKCKDGSIDRLGGAQKVMETIAGGPSDYHPAESSEDLNAIYKTISAGFSCQAAPAPTKVACTSPRPSINLLIDTSNSLEAELPALKTALLNFVRRLSATDNVMIEEFGHGNASGSMVLPLTNYGANKADIEAKINGLRVDESGNSYTRMKDGFSFAKNAIDGSSQKDYKQWSFIFFSDGHPKSAIADPDTTQYPTDIANSMKSSGMRVITVGLGADVNKDLMASIAGNNDDAHFANAAGDLDKVFSDISTTTTCQ